MVLWQRWKESLTNITLPRLKVAYVMRGRFSEGLKGRQATAKGEALRPDHPCVRSPEGAKSYSTLSGWIFQARYLFTGLHCADI